ncbi:MAG: HAD family hydrolase [Planctomycetota bacterium]|nr:HAD family hydrolase [Planctomycetota bacterium]MCX8039553.1 HAD family hydrolase [Planctomycetota bacterium]MDW8373362.1 HAD family hydrolase [Planctomycetota bacterium]
MIRAVIWDFDGTLVDSPPLVAAATNAALSEAGFAVVADLAAIRAGMALPTVPRMALHAGLPAEDPRAKSLADAFYRHAARLVPEYARPLPEVPETVRTLQARGIPQAIVSNNQGSLIRATLAAWGLRTCFASVLGDGDLPAPKPDPRGCWMAAAACAAAPADCAYIGDSLIDRDTALAAGMLPIAVAWGTTEPARLVGFARVVQQAHEILDLLDAMR